MPGRKLSLLVAAFVLASAATARAEEPLHDRIDRLIAAGAPDYDKKAAAIASDAEFIRRIHLDLTGTIPAAVDVRTFLDDSAADKRERLIDRLLASPEHARYLATVFDVLLMDRRPDKHVPRPQWQDYLRDSFAANKPWDQLVRELLAADGTDPKTRSAAKFYLDRDGEPYQLTRDIARLFLGMNVQCAQCHDHPIVRAYKQEHFYGLFAYLNRSYLFTDKAKLVTYAEKGEGDVSFQSVFDPNKVTKNTGPRMPFGKPVEEPAFEKGKEYDVTPSDGVRPVPKFSRRAQLGPQLASADNVQFKRAAANRFWALMMGRGLVHPIDLDHPANKPSHPELLTLLADELAAQKFDIRWFLRELALSRTYQRSSELRSGMKEVDPATFAVAALKPLGPEQLAWTIMQATGLTDAERLALGKDLSEAKLYAKLSGQVAPFVATFGGLAGQPESKDFQATLDQALFLTNGALIRGWLTPRAGNLTERLSKLSEPEAIADELYLSVLSRRPGDDERKDVVEYLKSRSEQRSAAFQELAWALLTSAEFRFNH